MVNLSRLVRCLMFGSCLSSGDKSIVSLNSRNEWVYCPHTSEGIRRIDILREKHIWYKYIYIYIYICVCLCVYVFIPCSVLTHASDWLTTPRSINTYLTFDVISMKYDEKGTSLMTMAIATAVHFPCRCDAAMRPSNTVFIRWFKPDEKGFPRF